MDTGKKITFVELIKENKILIPTIQRDYIQGRNDSKTSTVCTGLVDSITKALIENRNCHLNFTIGVNSDNTVFLLDGQQRITTLFLLHYYVAIRAGKLSNFIMLMNYNNDFEKKFTYYTRYTTQRFFDSLLSNDNNFDLSMSIDDNIKTSNWYSVDYEDDISIQSSITVLKKIEEKFNNVVDYNLIYDRLFNQKTITFFFLLDSGEKINKPHEHYLKINSRGKCLTDFELFKSTFLDKMNEALKKRIINDDFAKKIEDSIDYEWYEFFWNLTNPASSEKTDWLFRFFIHDLFSTIEIIDNDDFAKIEKKYDKYDTLYLFDYQDKYIEKFLCYLNLIIDALIKIKNEDVNFFDTIVKPWFTYESLYNSPAHKSRVIQFCISHYLYNKDNFKIADTTETLKRFILFIRNIVDNDEIDSLEKVYNRCKEFGKLTNSDFMLDNSIISKLDKFDSAIVSEEIEKINYINKYPTVLSDDVLLSAQNDLPFFNGRILFLLKLSDDVDNNTFDFLKFNQFKNNLQFITPENYDLLIAYFISKIDNLEAYLISKESSRIYTFGYNDTQHFKYHWRDRFNSQFDVYKSALIELLSSNDFTQYINDTITAYLSTHTTIDFKHFIVKHYSDFGEYTSINKYGRFWNPYMGDNEPYDSSNVYLMRNSVRGKYIHYLLYYLALEINCTDVIDNEDLEDGKKDNSHIIVNGNEIYYDYNNHVFCKDKEFTEQYKDDSDNTISDLKGMLQKINSWSV